MSVSASQQEDAQLACLAWYAGDMYNPLVPDQLAPSADPRLSADGWQLRGYLTGLDAYVRLKQKSLFGARRFYGYLAESLLHPGHFAIAIRGTMDILEWFADLEGFLVSHPDPDCGKVHLGIWDIYDSFEYDDPRATSSVLTAAPALKSVLDSHPVTIVGHSLGAPLASYLAFDLARAGCDVSAVLVASPRPGDADFAKAFGTAVPSYLVYNNTYDLVPRVPIGFGYEPLANVIALEPGNLIEDRPWCQHHCCSYIAIMDRSLLTPERISSSDKEYLSCLIGPPALMRATRC
jgi:hypothetical protein